MAEFYKGNPSNMPPLPLDTMPFGEVWKDFQAQNWIKDNDPSQSTSRFALGFARVTQVDYTLHTVTLLVLIGRKDFYLRAPIPISYPAAGARHFLGAMPTVGSHCVIGYLPSKPTETPVVLAWNIPNPWLGHDWVPSQEMQATEFDMNKRRQTELEGISSRERHKLRHMFPGNIVASSAQGADLVLDEGVLLMDRRGDEIVLRDQDSAIVFRSQQQFHAAGGVRQYTGMVQRDGSFLPTAMVSDGRRWDGPKLSTEGIPSAPNQLDPDLVRPEGVLVPHDVFGRVASGSAFADSGYDFQQSLDPYLFLRNGLFIAEDGFVVSPDLTIPDAEYNGKTIYRVSKSNPDSGEGLPVNAVLDAEPDSQALVEHRIEVNHSWDGRLPVTEQTDGFDADRLPPGKEDGAALASGERPMIEWVLGSVVGNDPFSDQGRRIYGRPVKPNVFDDDGGIRPTLESGIGVNIAEHCATLFRLDPPTNATFQPTFTSFTKDGRFKAFVSGPPRENSIELATSGGIKVQAGGAIDFVTGSPLNITAPSGDDEDNFGFCFTSPTGAICLTAGGATTRGSFSARTAPDGREENTLPGIIIEAPTSSVDITASRNVKIAGGSQIRLENTQEVLVTPQNQLTMTSDKLSQQCTTIDKTVLAKETVLYSGPKNSNPSNTPLRSVTFGANPLTGHVGGDTDVYKMEFGDRSEEFKVGSHTTNVQVGDLTYQTGVGTFKAQAGQNSMSVSTSGGLSATVLSGNLSMTSVTTSTMRGTSGVTVAASSGTARLSGTTTILGGSGGSTGGIVSGSDLDPLTNLPLSFFGMGSSGHLLGPAIP